MKTVNINASTNSKRIPIGRCEDNEATRVVFDCSGFSSAYGSGQATLLHRRSKEKISYIVQNVTQEDDAVTWTVSSDDTAFSGEGTLQLMWTVNDVVAHSVFYTTITDPSLTDSSSEPTEVKSALQLLIDSCYTKEEVDEAIANVPTGANWNANEGEDGYIENRPFYAETVEGEEVVHQLDPKYISGKFITSGTGENSEVYNDISRNVASGRYSHAEGCITMASGFTSHSEGCGEYNTKYTGTDEYKLPGAVGDYSHVEGYCGRAEGYGSHVEGSKCFTSKSYCHAEGSSTSSIARSAHSEGCETIASGEYSHSEGWQSEAKGQASHSEGYKSEARGSYSHCEGQGTVATANASHVGGKYNIKDTNNIYAEIIGNGTSDTARSNARTLDWSGNEGLAGSLTLGMNTNDEITITPAQLAKLLGLVKENHWESNFILPDGYISPSSSQVYTESEAASSSASNVYPVYYLPEEIDFDKLDSLDFKAVFSSQYASILIHKNITSFNNIVNAMWMSNCRGIGLKNSAFYIVRASDCYCNNEPYQFPSNVKTVIVIANDGSKPNLEHGVAVGSGFVHALSLDWTLK